MSRPADAARRGALALAAATVGLLTVLAVAVPAAATTPPAAPTESWAAELALDGGDDRGVELVDGAVRLTGAGDGSGELVLAPRRTRGVVDRVAGDAAADVPSGASVVVEARGLRRDGTWGPWITLPRDGTATLGGPTTEISVRVLLRRAAAGESPVLRGLWLTTSATPASPAPTTPSTTTTRPTTITTTTTTQPTTTTTTTQPTTTTTTTQPTTTTTTPATTAPTTTTTAPTTTTTTPAPTTTTTTGTTTRPTTTRPTTTTTEPTTTTAAPTSTTTAAPTTTTTTRPTCTTTPSRRGGPRPSDPTCTTTPVVVPPPGLVPGVPLPGVTLPTLPTLPTARAAADPPQQSWWGAQLVDWLAHAF